MASHHSGWTRKALLKKSCLSCPKSKPFVWDCPGGRGPNHSPGAGYAPGFALSAAAGFVRRLTGAGVHARTSSEIFAGVWTAGRRCSATSACRVMCDQGRCPAARKHDHVVFIVGGRKCFNDPCHWLHGPDRAGGGRNPSHVEDPPEPLSGVFRRSIDRSLKGAGHRSRRRFWTRNVAGLGKHMFARRCFGLESIPRPAGLVAKPHRETRFRREDVLTCAIVPVDRAQDIDVRMARSAIFNTPSSLWARGGTLSKQGCGDAVRRMTQGGRRPLLRDLLCLRRLVPTRDFTIF